jgi:hypothetical protein
MADVAWNMGLVDAVQREVVRGLQQRTVDLLDSRRFREARAMSDVVEAYIVQVCGWGWVGVGWGGGLVAGGWGRWAAGGLPACCGPW